MFIIATVALVPEHLESPVGLKGAVRTATRCFPKLGEWISTIEADLGGIRFGLGVGDSMPLLADLLNQDDDGLLLTLDEAHEAPSDRLGRFLNAVQLAGRSRPTAAVLAGTPGLEAVLRAAHASFWSRGEKRPIGLLEDDSARDALARPFRGAGLDADDRAAMDLATAADNYPYFLQLYGREAWRVVEASEARTFLPEHVAPTLAVADVARRRYYLDRYNEFDDAELLPLAHRVTEAFVESAAAPADRHLSNAALNGLVADGGGKDGKAFLIAKGYVWQDGSADHFWTPGIPSLMD